VVDQVITKFIVPRLNKHQSIDQDETLAYASKLMERQLAFGKAMRYREGNINKGDDYCAFFELEYEGKLDDKTVQNACEEVKISLINLLNSKLMSEICEEGLYLIAQRSLHFTFSDVTVSCTPDLIVFFNSKEPIIIDWKVEAPTYKEHWLQLGVYGVALSRVTPHKDFPVEWCSSLTDPTKIGLIEFQLLRNQELKYFLTQEDIIDIEDYIYTSSNRMRQMINGSNKKPELLINLLPTARSPEACIRCKFRKICWKELTS
jgi:CRISPR/Cas system-associated exonuclease Cas4 (RecB family)